MSYRNIEQPVTKTVVGAGRQEETETSHPAFVQIGASRVSGRVNLYDSDFTHHHYIVIRIDTSTLRRSLNRDWHFSHDRGFVEVALSESQWATFVSTLNMGSGVPATLQRFDGAVIAGLPDPQPRAKQAGDEVKKKLSDALAAIKDATEEIDKLGLSKVKSATMREKLRSAHAVLSDSVPFAVRSFDEHTENTVERGKQEIHGYMTGMVQRAGLDALAGGMTPPLLLGTEGVDE